MRIRQHVTDEQGSSLLASVFVLIELLFIIAALILGLAFLLGLIGANPDALFAKWIYDRQHTLMIPFNGIFNDITPQHGPKIHTSLLFGILIYVLIAAVLEGTARRLRRS